jgi:5-methylcytosine-specific restriction protein B
MAIKKIGISTEWATYEELKQRCVVAQGWDDSGDLSFLWDKENEENIDKFLNLFTGGVPKGKNAFSNIFRQIKSGDIVLAFEGNTVKGICEMPEDFVYFYDDDAENYRNCLFPVRWVDWDSFCPDPKLRSCGGQGVKGIENCNLEDVNNYINRNWEKYKKKHNIDAQPEEQAEKLKLLHEQMPEKIKKSREYYYNKLKNQNIMDLNQEYTNLLLTNKNIILTGAPGTGKTYKTAEIALQILGKADIDFSDRKAVMTAYKQAEKEGLIKFTTFHQSMDYEEFVEGLKPDCDIDGNITYSVKPGIFKRLCQDTEEQGSIAQLDKAIEQFKELCSEKTQEVKTVTGVAFSVSYRGGITFRVRSENSQAEQGHDFPANIENIRRLYAEDTTGTYNIPYVRGILNHLKNTYNISPYKIVQNQKYVLIIDEINRGNISKIFGELITLLEKDKRLGAENEICVKLPYSQETFGVPSNLYIIGTMNTADRSIGHIDYAVRRRFAFVPLKADRRIIENHNYENDDTKQRALNVFDSIKEFIKEKINTDLDAEDLMIGHSYFLCETTDDLKMRLEYEIIPLIGEYEKDGIILITGKEDFKSKIIEWKTML